MQIGERAIIANGPFKGRSFIVLSVMVYRTEEDDIKFKKAIDELEENRRLRGHIALGCLMEGESNGRIYRVRFDDGLITEILDFELINGEN